MPHASSRIAHASGSLHVLTWDDAVTSMAVATLPILNA